MDVRVKATDYNITPEVEAYLDDRLRSLERLLADGAALARVEVELGRDAGRPRHGAYVWFAEILVACPGEEPVRATNHSESINGAIDDVKEEVERQLRNRKRFHRYLMRKSGAMLKRMMRFGR